jgi:23S rRNA (adenine2503-C2)-methyltransferase
VADLGAFIANSTLADQIQRDIRIELPQIIDTLNCDGVVKLILRLDDGCEIESVILPMPNHVTVCISCQAGCRMGCRFCQTGRMGLQRHLRPAEIVVQVYLIKVVLGYKVRNVVFMGMGEPMDNLDNVIQALRVLSDQRGLNIALRHITLSTVGLFHNLDRLARLNWPQLSLAISLNAPDDSLRRHLMPATRPYPLDSIKQALLNYPLAKGKFFFIAYVLIKGINDSDAHAWRLAAFLRDLPVKVNLIPYNPGPHCSYEVSTASQVERFRRAMVDAGFFVRLRGAKGESIQAACGQLARSLRTRRTQCAPPMK